MAITRRSRRRAVRRAAAVDAITVAGVGMAFVWVAARTGEESAGGSADTQTAVAPQSGGPPGASSDEPSGAPPGSDRASDPESERRSDRPAREAVDRWPEPQWRDSAALGVPEGGRLARGVRFPREGRHFFTWDPVERESPNRPWRRWGTNVLVRLVLDVLADHRRAYPRAPRLGVGDLSRPHGGDFGPQYGIVGHASHQNGLDADIYYPLKSGDERSPLAVDEVDLRLSQDLVDRFVAAGAERVFVGPATGLTGPAEVVQAIPYHDNHLHVRIPDPG
ncbi:hypothetical protein BH24ACT25_BH24ACT25_09830 [soil metagenome]